MKSNRDCGIPDNPFVRAQPIAQVPRHLLIPFAAVSAPGCQALLPKLQWPNLQALLALLTEQVADRGDDHSLSPPHERALARALQLPVSDGLIPWAAAQSETPTVAQAWFSLCHFQVGMEQVTLLPGAQLAVDEATSRALFAAFAPLCTEDGIALRWDSPTEWHAAGEPLRGIACASLDRVSGRMVDAWMAESAGNAAGGQLLKRLQSEAQMLFYTHPAHDARTAQGLLPVNGFWVHGAGALETAPGPGEEPTMPDGLRQAALQNDWVVWQAAWTQLDRVEIAALLADAQHGETVRLTLCGERHARTWTYQPTGTLVSLGRKFKQLFAAPSVAEILKDL